MKTLFKFNQRAKLVDNDSNCFAFGINIANIENNKFSFDIVNGKGESIQFINMNEWKIHTITSSHYFEREKISLDFSDPKDIMQKLETGGRTINYDSEDAINSIAYCLLTDVLIHFHRISCFENIDEVVRKHEQLINIGETEHARLYDHRYMDTRYF